MRTKSILAVAALLLGLAGFSVPAQAQITTNLKFNVSHPWIVMNKTMPAGTYSFEMSRGTQQQQMIVTNLKTKDRAVFAVEQDSHTYPPHHSELVFDRIGNKEFLSRIYQSGARYGVAIAPCKEEARLEKQGQKPVEDTQSEGMQSEQK